MTAYAELIEYLNDGETIEAVVFGEWGLCFDENPDIPEGKRRIVLSLHDAMPYMQNWRFFKNQGQPECYAAHVWTNERVIFVQTYAGVTELKSIPRNPSTIDPEII